MSFASAQLPEDYAELRALAAALQHKNLSLQGELEARDATLKTRDVELQVYKDEVYAKTLLIEKYKAQLAVLRRARFGRSSEKLDREIEQMELMLGDLEEGQAQLAAKREAREGAASLGNAAAPRVSRTEPTRRALPDHLPRERVDHTPDCTCPSCGGTRLRQIGVDEREVIEYVPSHFKVIVHVRPKLACRACEAITQVPMPSLPIVRGLPGPALLAHVITSKYCDHLPLYRQSEIYARENVELDRSTLAQWVGHMAALLMPLADAIAKHVRAGETVHADDTIVPALDPGRGKTKTGRLWVALRDESPFGSTVPPAVLYQYAPDRTMERAEALLKGCSGYLHSDAYSGFNSLYAPDPITGVPRFRAVSCWAHGRRYIYEAHVQGETPVTLGLLQRIGQLFDIEADIKGQSPEDRRRVRLEHSVPLLEDLKQTFDTTLLRISGKVKLAEGIRYITSRWESFTRYTTDGRLEICNNAVERAIRPLTLGRKNWLFVGSDTGGERAALMYTIIQSAKLNGLDPEAYLRDIISRIADHPINRIDELLPWNVRQ